MPLMCTSAAGSSRSGGFGRAATSPPVAINHLYNHDAYWSDNPIFGVGSSLYTTQHGSTLAGSGTFVIGADLVTFVDGLVTQIQAGSQTNHVYPHDAYWSDDAVLVSSTANYNVSGSTLYTGQYTNIVADTISFTEGNTDISTNSSGEVTWPYHGETFTDMIRTITYYADVRYPATGDILYTYPYRNVVAASALSFVVQYEGWDYSLTTDINGVVTRDYVFNHPYQHHIYWSDDEGLISGTSILYDNPHANPNYPGATDQNWTDGGYNFSTDAAGVVTWSDIFNWSYPHGDYWSGDATLVNGSILYTGQHSPTLATNVSFDAGNQTIDTDGNGVVSIGYKWIGTTTCNSVLSSTLYTSGPQLVVFETTVYSDRLRSSPGGNSIFAYEGHLYEISPVAGVISSIAFCTPYN